MKIKDYKRQGDVLVFELELSSLEGLGTKKSDNILALGEETGHRHEVATDKEVTFLPDGEKALEVEGAMFEFLKENWKKEFPDIAFPFERQDFAISAFVVPEEDTEITHQQHAKIALSKGSINAVVIQSEWAGKQSRWNTVVD